MLGILSAALVFSVLSCDVLEPLAPSTSRAVESAWGDWAGGLSILVATDSARIDLGRPIPLEVFFRFSPFESDGVVRSLDSYGNAEAFELELTDRENGTRYTRRTSSGARFPRHPTDHVDLTYGQVCSRSLVFRTLIPCGEAVPPGHYSVTLAYRNSGQATHRPVFDSETWKTEAVPYDPGTLWSGSARSGPLSIRIVHRDADTTRVDLPESIEIVWDERTSRMRWKWGPGSPAVILSRPGFNVLCEIEPLYLVGSDPLPRFVRPGIDSLARWEPWSDLDSIPVFETGSLPLPGAFGSFVSGPRLHRRLGWSNPFRVRLRMRIVESTAAEGWRPPGSCGYRVLRETVLEDRWP